MIKQMDFPLSNWASRLADNLVFYQARILKGFCLGIIFLSFCLQFTPSAAIKTSTLGIRLSLDAGSSYSGEIELANYYPNTKKVQVTLADWELRQNGNSTIRKANTLPLSLVPWIEAKPRKFKLQPGEEKEVHYEVSLPKEAQGTRWCALLVTIPLRQREPDYPEEGVPEGQEGGDIRFSIRSVNFRLAIKVIVTEPSSSNREAKITSFKLTRSGPHNSVLEGFKVTFNNTGNAILDPFGEVKILDENSNLVKSIDIQKFTILPRSNRILTTAYEGKNLPSGRYKAVVELHYAKDKITQKELKFTVNK